jgi:hypothetical protein
MLNNIMHPAKIPNPKELDALPITCHKNITGHFWGLCNSKNVLFYCNDDCPLSGYYCSCRSGQNAEFKLAVF